MDTEPRVLMRLATAKDAELTCGVLADAGIPACHFGAMQQLVEALDGGAGALMLAEETLAAPALQLLTQALAAQPPWSDLPQIVLARPGADSRAIDRVLQRLPNATVVERPVRIAALVSVVRSALRARHRQYELRRLFDGMRLADQRKTEFLATLAHELRNPLAPISTALALLARKQPDAAEAARYHDLMRRQVEHMVRLVNDLMEVSRITRGKVELQRLPLLLDALLDGALEFSRPLLEAAGHTLEVHRPAEVLVVSGDPVRLTQVLTNLLNNAAKYTPPGGLVTLAARHEGDDIVIDVRDTGVGLAPEMLTSIFEAFVQVSGTSRMAQGGLGIGLTLAKNLVELHGGSLAAHSEGLGRGAVFSVRLPLLRQPPAQHRDEAPSRWPQLAARHRVLVVDDNRDAADSLAELLRASGAAVVVAYDGEEALRRAGKQAFDAAVLDIGMPGMDGATLAGRLRTLPHGGAKTMIALTGWGQEEDRRRIAAAGFDHHLLKPVDANTLLALLSG